MDSPPEMETLTIWLAHYGSFALFGLLILGIIAFPIPEETMMVIAGILMYDEKLSIYPTLLSAYAGSIVGITISYLLGRTAGQYIMHKYGNWLGLTPAVIQKMHNWFERFGPWVLFFGYFIPGVRHFSGFSAGTTGLSYKKFAIFAYSGAIVWVTTFLSIGYFFGRYWLSAFESLNIEEDTEGVIIILILLCLCFFIYKLKKH